MEIQTHMVIVILHCYVPSPQLRTETTAIFSYSLLLLLIIYYLQFLRSVEFSYLVEVGNVEMCGTRDIITEHGNCWILTMAVKILTLWILALLKYVLMLFTNFWILCDISWLVQCLHFVY
jgi:hypothetical protein